MTPKIVVCGLGPGGANQLTEATTASFDSIEHRYLRTCVHPTADRVNASASFDHLYEKADSFAEVYQKIAVELLEEANKHGEILYAVPGSPLVLEQSVRNLRQAAPSEGVELELLPAISFLDEVWARLQLDPVEETVTLIDGHQFASAAAGHSGPLLVAHTHANWVLSDIKLSVDVDDSHTVVVLQRLGTDDEHIEEIVWSDLDRVIEPDHLTSLYIPQLAAPVGHELIQSVQLMERLRRDCPWDAKQTHGSLRKYLIEEAYEVADVLDRFAAVEASSDDDDNSPEEVDAFELYDELEEELGDLWFQVLFHALLAQEEGYFSIADVARTLYAKMVERHPHVFEQATSDSAAKMPTVETWEQLKQQEKKRTSAFDDIPLALPSLSRADKVIKRGKRAGFAVEQESIGGLLAGVSNIDENATHQQIGRVLLGVVLAASNAKVDPELALREVVTSLAETGRQIEDGGQPPRSEWFDGLFRK